MKDYSSKSAFQESQDEREASVKNSWFLDTDVAFYRAQVEKKNVLLAFFDESKTSELYLSKIFSTETWANFSNQNIIPVLFYKKIQDNSGAAADLIEKYKITTFPAFLVLNSSGRLLGKFFSTIKVDAENFINSLEAVIHLNNFAIKNYLEKNGVKEKKLYSLIFMQSFLKRKSDYITMLKSKEFDPSLYNEFKSLEQKLVSTLKE